MADLIARVDAIELLTSQRSELLSLVEQLPPKARIAPGLGGGEWSPKDLLGHIESWEQHVLTALESWAENKGAPIDAAIYGEGINAINAAAVAQRASRGFDEQLAATLATRERLLSLLTGMSDEAWRTPATSRARKPLGERVGSLLVGKKDPFTHDSAHLPDLRRFLEEHAAG